MDRKEAAEILGVKTDSERRVIEQKYYGLFQRYKRTKNNDPEKEKEFQEVMKAYHILMDYEMDIPEEKKPPNPMYKKMGLDQKKTENFLHYYKAHIIISIIVIVFLYTTIVGIINRVPSELEITILGDIYMDDTEILKEKIMLEMDYLPELSITHVLLSEDLDGEQQYAYQMKAQIQFAAANVDIFILDETNYRNYARLGAFKDIKELVLELGLDINSQKHLEVKLEDTGELGIYGIDITDNKFFDELLFTNEKLVAVIGLRGEYPENAIELLKIILNNEQN